MRQRQNFLTLARNLCAEAEEISFYIRLKETIGNRHVFSFWNKMELAEILAKLDLDDYELVDNNFHEF